MLAFSHISLCILVLINRTHLRSVRLTFLTIELLCIPMNFSDVRLLFVYIHSDKILYTVSILKLNIKALGFVTNPPLECHSYSVKPPRIFPHSALMTVRVSNCSNSKLL